MTLAGKIYVLEGLGFVLLTFVLFVLAATGPGTEVSTHFITADDGRQLRYYGWQPPEAQVFLPFFAWMILWGILAAAVGFLQDRIAIRPLLQVIGALAYGFGVFGYVFLFYFNRVGASRGESVGMQNPVTWTVYLGGFSLLLALAVNLIGVVAPGRTRRSVPEENT